MLGDGGEPVADLHALDRVDRHQRTGQVAIELAVDRFAPARRHAVGDHVDARADRIAGLAQRVDISLQRRHLGRIGPEERVLLHRVPVERVRHDLADLRQVAAHAHAVMPGQPFLGDHRGSHAHGGLARRGAPAAARVADAIFLPVGVVGVAGTEGLLDLAIVLAALVGVADQQRDRRTGGLAPVDPGEDLHLVRLVPLRGVAAAPGGAALEIVAKLLRRDRQPRRTAVDHTADRRPVAFAEGRDGQELAEGIAGHGASGIKAQSIPAPPLP